MGRSIGPPGPRFVCIASNLKLRRRSGSVTLRPSFGEARLSTELDQFIRDALARGLPRQEIRDVLVRAGWREEEIDGALGQWAEIAYPIPVPRRRPYLSAREAFLYLVLFATLYVVAFNVGSLLLRADRVHVAGRDEGGGEPHRDGGTRAVRDRVDPDRLSDLPVRLAQHRASGRARSREARLEDP